MHHASRIAMFASVYVSYACTCAHRKFFTFHDSADRYHYMRYEKSKIFFTLVETFEISIYANNINERRRKSVRAIFSINDPLCNYKLYSVECRCLIRILNGF